MRTTVEHEWPADVAMRAQAVSAGELRWAEAGRGRPVVLLHTLRTQLEMFHRVIPLLSAGHRVIAVDLPGHGQSARPQARYTPEFFAHAIGEFLDALQLRDAVVVGESIGAGVALLMASRGHRRVAHVVAVNPYDYDRGRGVRRSALAANVMFALLPVAGLGPLAWAMRSRLTVRMVMRGGVTDDANLPAWLVDEVYAATKRSGDGEAFIDLVRNFPSWEATRSTYRAIAVPVDLVYGEHDWSRAEERNETSRLLAPRSRHEVPGGGHFLALDRPEALAEIIRLATDVRVGRRRRPGLRRTDR